MNKIQNIFKRLGFSRRDALDLEKALSSSSIAIMAMEKRLLKLEQTVANLSKPTTNPITVTISMSIRGLTLEPNQPFQVSVNTVSGLNVGDKIQFDNIDYNSSKLKGIISNIEDTTLTIIPIVNSSFETTINSGDTITTIIV